MKSIIKKIFKVYLAIIFALALIVLTIALICAGSAIYDHIGKNDRAIAKDCAQFAEILYGSTVEACVAHQKAANFKYDDEGNVK